MRTYAIINPIFNRKKIKLSKDDSALIQLEIIFVDQSKMYISTGIYLHPGQWDAKHHCVINLNTAGQTNKAINDTIGKVRSHELRLNDEGSHLTRRSVIGLLNEPGLKKDSFVEFMVREIAKRKDIHVATRYRHTLVSEELKSLDILSFSDLTLHNIQKYDDYLKGKKEKMMQTTVVNRHKVVKTYIHKAVQQELMKMDENPYLRFTVASGKSRIRTRLDDNELTKMIEKDIPDPLLAFVRDMYIFQAFTGISYRDMVFTDKQVKNNKGELWIEGLRKKNGEYYSVYLLPEAVRLLKKYRSKEPGQCFAILPQYDQNRKLKIVAAKCEIEKNLTTHTARHTAASWMIRSGVPITVIRDILGHSSIDTTMIYAKLDNKTIMEEMKKANLKRR